MKAFVRSKLVSSLMILPLVALFVIAVAVAVISPFTSSHAAASAAISLSLTQATAGTTVTVTGSGWATGDLVALHFDSSAQILARPTIASDGTFQATVSVPAGTTVGAHLVVAVDEITQETAEATLTVVPVVPSLPSQELTPIRSGSSS